MWTKLDYDKPTPYALDEEQKLLARTTDKQIRRGAIERCRGRIKRNSERCRAWKRLLRNPHKAVYALSACMITASVLQMHVAGIRHQITQDLVYLHRLRGTEDAGRSHLPQHLRCAVPTAV